MESAFYAPLLHKLSAGAGMPDGRSMLVGRGCTALWLALKAIRARLDLVSSASLPEIVIPDLLCSVVLDTVILAGFRPRFAAVDPLRFTVNAAMVAAAITPATAVILVAHTFGHAVDVESIRRISNGIPVIEDAVQGIGGTVKGQALGTLGDYAFISFDPTKMIGGRGAILTWPTQVEPPPQLEHSRIEWDIEWDSVHRVASSILPPLAAIGYVTQLRDAAPSLICAFDDSATNVAQITADWSTLPLRVQSRYAQAEALQAALQGLSLPLTLPPITNSDALCDSLWRYTFAAPSRLLARRIVRKLSEARIMSTNLYGSLSHWLGQPAVAPVGEQLVNLWIDETVDPRQAMQTASIIRAALT